MTRLQCCRWSLSHVALRIFTYPSLLLHCFGSMHPSPSTYYTNLYPKRPDVSGSPDQAYNFTLTRYFDHFTGGIAAGTIAAIGTLAPGSSTLTYCYAPRIHTDLSGSFIGFVGNSSNKIGEFSCVFVSRDAFGVFPSSTSRPPSSEESTLLPPPPVLETHF